MQIYCKKKPGINTAKNGEDERSFHSILMLTSENIYRTEQTLYGHPV